MGPDDFARWGEVVRDLGWVAVALAEFGVIVAQWRAARDKDVRLFRYLEESNGIFKQIAKIGEGAPPAALPPKTDGGKP